MSTAPAGRPAPLRAGGMRPYAAAQSNFAAGGRGGRPDRAGVRGPAAALPGPRKRGVGGGLPLSGTAAAGRGARSGLAHSPSAGRAAPGFPRFIAGAARCRDNLGNKEKRGHRDGGSPARRFPTRGLATFSRDGAARRPRPALFCGGTRGGHRAPAPAPPDKGAAGVGTHPPHPHPRLFCSVLWGVRVRGGAPSHPLGLNPAGAETACENYFFFFFFSSEENLQLNRARAPFFFPFFFFLIFFSPLPLPV